MTTCELSFHRRRISHRFHARQIVVLPLTSVLVWHCMKHFDGGCRAWALGAGWFMEIVGARGSKVSSVGRGFGAEGARFLQDIATCSSMQDSADPLSLQATTYIVPSKLPTLPPPHLRPQISEKVSHELSCIACCWKIESFALIDFFSSTQRTDFSTKLKQHGRKAAF